MFPDIWLVACKNERVVHSSQGCDLAGTNFALDNFRKGQLTK
jgi:hypothetical protein